MANPALAFVGLLYPQYIVYILKNILQSVKNMVLIIQDFELNESYVCNIKQHESKSTGHSVTP